MPAPAFALSVTVNQADINRITKRLDKWQGKPLADRMAKATQAGLGLYVSPLKGASPGPGRERPPVDTTGNLRNSIGVRKLKKRPGNLGEVAAYAVGPRSNKPWKGFHRHLVIRGHKMVTHKPARRTVGFVTGQPFVDGVYAQLEPAVSAFISEQVRRLA